MRNQFVSKRLMDLMSLVCFFCLASLLNGQEAKPKEERNQLALERKQLTLEDIQNNLSLAVASFDLKLATDVTKPVDYFVRFEYWQKGKLNQAVRSKDFTIDPQNAIYQFSSPCPQIAKEWMLFFLHPI